MYYWRVVIAIIWIALIVFLITGCTDRDSKLEGDKTPGRFTVETVDTNIQILTDNQTGVQYLVYMGTGITKLEAGEGNG